MGWTLHHDTAKMNWTQARDWCQAHHTDLVSIQNQTENDYVLKHLPNRTGTPYYWIGLTRTAEKWIWIGTNGTLAGYKSWAPNEPNNRTDELCVEMYVNKDATTRGKWNDEPCSKLKFPACFKGDTKCCMCSNVLVKLTCEVCIYIPNCVL